MLGPLVAGDLVELGAGCRVGYRCILGATVRGAVLTTWLPAAPEELADTIPTHTHTHTKAGLVSQDKAMIHNKLHKSEGVCFFYNKDSLYLLLETTLKFILTIIS